MKSKILNTITILNILIMVYLINGLDNIPVPIHYNIQGYADIWANKWILIIFSFIPLLLSIILEVYGNICKNKEEVQEYEKYGNTSISILIIFFIIVDWIIFIPCFNQNTRFDMKLLSLIIIPLGVLIIYLSSFMSKIKQNRTFGIRTPWALKDKNVWDKTQRFGGISGMIGGSIIVIFGIMGSIFNLGIFYIIGILIGILLLTLVPFIYSYLVYSKTQK